MKRPSARAFMAIKAAIESRITEQKATSQVSPISYITLFTDFAESSLKAKYQC